MSYGTKNWGHFFFSALKRSPYVTPQPFKPDYEGKYMELTRPWLQLKEFNVETCESRLPEHYKKFYWEWKYSEKSPVHHIKDRSTFKLDPDKETVIPVEHFVPQIIYPTAVDEGLWGGMGIVKGYVWRGRYKGEQPKYWWPKLRYTVLYSEILDKYMRVIVTARAVRLINEHYGLDSYLMKTPYADINSVLGFRMKREMLLALANQTLYPHDPSTREELTKKYEEFIIPAEEADWIGLTLDEATLKQEQLEEQERESQLPLKHVFRAQLVQHLRANPPHDTTEKLGKKESSWFSLPFRKS